MLAGALTLKGLVYPKGKTHLLPDIFVLITMFTKVLKIQNSMKKKINTIS